VRNKKHQKLYPPTFFNLSVLLIILIHFIFPIEQIIDGYLRFISLPFLIFGISVNLLADNEFKSYKTTVKPFHESDNLIEDGIFSISRNPMYLGMTFILLSLAIFLGSISPFVIVLIFPLAMLKYFIQYEEEMLSKKFGERWDLYSNRVRRWL
jgi:protein-S-isoprenylcysteine O-methyltransferase Ste14